MSTHNIGFYEDLTKLSLNYHQISSNTHLISSVLLTGMVLIWSLSQHVGRRVTCLPAAVTTTTTRQFLKRFFVVCHSCHAYRKHCDSVLLWRNRTQNYHRLGGQAATGMLKKSL